MGEAARKRRLGLVTPHAPKPKGPDVKLDNPMRGQFATFIFANAMKWEALAHDELIRVNPDAAAALDSPAPFEGILGFIGRDGRPVEAHESAYEQWTRFRKAVEEHCTERFVVVEGSAAGQHIVICGAGPSLTDHAEEHVPTGDQVWGVNSALPYLADKGFRVTHGLTVDQTPHMCTEWFSAPDVEYLVASTVHPHLTEYLQKKGRRLRFFNNYVGLKQKPVIAKDSEGVTRAMSYEHWLYSVLFQSTVMCGSGLNSVTRAIDLALFMGAEKVTVLGADCALRVRAPLGKEVIQGSAEHVAWLHGAQLHADGGHALASEATPLTFGGLIDGRHWETKPDMAISAVWLNKMRNRLEGKLVLIGDTLPNALRGKSEEFLARMPTLVDSAGKAIPIDE